MATNALTTQTSQWLGNSWNAITMWYTPDTTEVAKNKINSSAPSAAIRSRKVGTLKLWIEGNTLTKRKNSNKSGRRYQSFHSTRKKTQFTIMEIRMMYKILTRFFTEFLLTKCFFGKIINYRFHPGKQLHPLVEYCRTRFCRNQFVFLKDTNGSPKKYKQEVKFTPCFSFMIGNFRFE